jgi:hypothetical protein
MPPLNDFKRVYLVDRPPPGEPSLLVPLERFRFAPLVSSRLHLIAGLEILLLRREEPGSVVTQGGDIDNRIKTLLDALRMPKDLDELPAGDAPSAEEDPFFCLLEDDALVTELAIVTDRLLEPGQDSTASSHVRLVIKVTLNATRLVWGNASLIG